LRSSPSDVILESGGGGGEDTSLRELESEIAEQAASLQWLAVFELMLKARDTSKQPSAATKNRALYAYAKTGKWELALVLATNMQERGEADHETYGCSLAACDVG